jgi:hypothetical protein
MHVLQISLCSAIAALCTWPWLGWKGAVWFIPIWVGFETLYRLKVQSVLNCESCGFDPLTYLVDVKKARSQVDTFWRNRFAEKGIPYPGESGKTEVTQSVASNSP